jgi:Cellulose binding domain
MFTRRGRHVAGAAVAVLALGGAGAAVAWHESAGKTHAQTVSAYCGLVACAVLHSGGTATATPAASVPVTGLPTGRARVSLETSPTPAASAASPTTPVTAPTTTPTTGPTPTPVPAPGPSPTPPTTPPGPSPTPPSAAVTVTYSTPQQWPGGFQGELTIVNRGSAAVTGWQIMLTLPGDWVQTVWNATWQPAGWGSVIMTPTPGDQVIEPGATLSVSFIAKGNTTEPANCTFNGSPCS